MWAQKHSHDDFITYTKQIFEQFFKRKLILDDKNEIIQVLNSCNIPINSFDSFLKDEGKRALEEIEQLAKELGVFGVPTWSFEDGELFFGQDRIGFVEEKLVKEGFANPGYYQRKNAELVNQLNQIKSNL